jgi:hypothetical protein
MVEVLVAVAIIGILFVALYSGLSAGFAVVQLSRENLRATQILQEKMETIRLYTWEQINTSGFIPEKFIEGFYPSSEVKNTMFFTGAVTIASCPINESYSNDLRMVTVELKWLSANVPRTREMSTFVSRYGLQNYIY